MATDTATRKVTDGHLRTILDSIDDQKPNGPALAALLAAGVGATALGVFTTLAAWSTDFKNALVIDKGVGPLSGKTTYAVVTYLVAWAILGFVMRGKQYPERPLFITTFALIALGVLGTFPIFYDLFAP